jgi:hypothetical protein
MWGTDFLGVAVSCGENCILIALFILSTKMFKMGAPFLGHPILVTIYMEFFLRR